MLQAQYMAVGCCLLRRLMAREGVMINHKNFRRLFRSGANWPDTGVERI